MTGQLQGLLSPGVLVAGCPNLCYVVSPAFCCTPIQRLASRALVSLAHGFLSSWDGCFGFPPWLARLYALATL